MTQEKMSCVMVRHCVMPCVMVIYDPYRRASSPPGFFRPTLFQHANPAPGLFRRTWGEILQHAWKEEGVGVARQEAGPSPSPQGFPWEISSMSFLLHEVSRPTAPHAGQLLRGALGVAGRRVQALMPEDLRQAHKIVAVRRQELVRHCVPEQVRVQLDARDGAVLLAQSPHTPLRQWTTLPDEHPGLDCTGGRACK